MLSGAGAVAVEAGVEVEETAVLLGQAAVPVIANASGERERGGDLVLILNVGAELVGTIVAAGIALQEGAYIEAGRRAARSYIALHELAEVVGGDGSGASALVNGIELGVAIAGAEAESVAAKVPDGLARGGNAVLEDAGVRCLALGVGSDVQDSG